jgi:hypothetical protein
MTSALTLSAPISPEFEGLKARVLMATERGPCFAVDARFRDKRRLAGIGLALQLLRPGASSNPDGEHAEAALWPLSAVGYPTRLARTATHGEKRSGRRKLGFALPPQPR